MNLSVCIVRYTPEFFSSVLPLVKFIQPRIKRTFVILIFAG